jgi:DNA-binding SARP family transcriptional activator
MAARQGPEGWHRPLWRLSLLGGLELSKDDAVQELPASVQRLLAFVTLNGRSGRASLAGALWPEASEGHAHGSLRSALWRLGKSQPGMLLLTGNSVALDTCVSVDVHELCATAELLLAGAAPSAGRAVPSDLLDGELLPGWYDDWVLFERERLRQLRLHALEALAVTLAEQGRFAAAVQVGLAAVRIEPLRESAHRAVIRVHLAEGNVTEAVRQYRFCRRLFQQELGLEPSTLLTGLIPELRSKQAGDALVTGG